MTHTAEFRLRRRVLEPSYRNLRSWNFKPEQLQCFVHAIFMERVSLYSRVIVKVLFSEHWRFQSLWFSISWHMGIFRIKMLLRIQIWMWTDFEWRIDWKSTKKYQWYCITIQNSWESTVFITCRKNMTLKLN